MNIATLLIGTNLGKKINNLSIAKENINIKAGNIIDESNIIESKPEEFISKNYFLNQKIKIETYHNPFILLNILKKIESHMGRTYNKLKNKEAYSDRIIDIDILYFNNIKIISPILIIPHPQINNRKFIKKLCFR